MSAAVEAPHSMDVEVIESMLHRPCSERHKKMLQGMLHKAKTAKKDEETLALLQKKYGVNADFSEPDSPLPSFGSRKSRNKKPKMTCDGADDSATTPKKKTPKKRPGRQPEVIETPGSCLSVGANSPPPPPSDSDSSSTDDEPQTGKKSTKRKRKVKTPGGRKRLAWCSSADETEPVDEKSKKPKWSDEEIAVLYTIASDWK